MSVNLSLFAGAGSQFFDDNGVVLAGGKIYSYVAGTSTPLNTYTTSTGLVAHSNPIVLDSAGRVPGGEIWAVDGQAYKFVLKNANDELIQTYDNIYTTFKADSLSNTTTFPAGDSLVGYRASSSTGFFTGSVGRTLAAKVQEFSLSILDFGAIPNDSSTAAKAANDAAFANAIASFASSADSGNGGNYYGMGGRLRVPFVGNGGGNFYMGSTINIDRAITLEFESPVTGNSVGASRLIFPQDTTGIIVWGKEGSPSGLSGQGAQIINASLLGPGHAAGSTGYGIEVKGTCTLISCTVDSFRSDGVHIYGQAGVTGNANLFRITNGRFMSNGGHGLYVDGPDANAGVIIGLDASSNDGWGIYDSSFLGNTYVQCHTSANILGSYKSEGLVNASTFLGCYSESGQNPFEFQQATTIVGGLLSAGLAPDPIYPGSAFVGVLHAANGQPSAPAITCASDYTTGFYLQNVGLFRFSQLGNFRAQFGDYLKWSSSGSFYDINIPLHEFVQSQAAQPISIDYATSTSYTGYGKWSKAETAAGTGFNLFTGSNASAVCYQVLGNGNVQNTNNSYGAISDIKFKQDITDATSQWNDVKAVRLRKYRLKNDPNGVLQLGVIAQELEQVSPGLVEETPDRDEKGEQTGDKSKSVKYSVLLLKALGALQEAMARIEKLEQQIEGAK